MNNSSNIFTNIAVLSNEDTQATGFGPPTPITKPNQPEADSFSNYNPYHDTQGHFTTEDNASTIVPDNQKRFLHIKINNHNATISRDAYEFIISQETSGRAAYSKQNCHPHWPGGKSGITIGFGYDLGCHTKEEIRNDWKDLVSEADLEKLVALSLVRKEQAKGSLHLVQNIIIPISAAEKVY